MSDLPSRESFKRSGVTLMDAKPILAAYVRGDLQTDAERREAIDYEAAIKVAIEWLAAYVGNPPAVAKAIVDAAIGDTSA